MVNSCKAIHSARLLLCGISDENPTFVQASEPASLSRGTEVSAKYKGAFCEATVKEVKKLVKCRVS